MGPLALRATAGLRRHARVVLPLTLVLALSFAVTLVCVAGGRRGSSALDRFIAHNRPGSVLAFVDPSLPRDEQADVLGRMQAELGGGPAMQGASVVVAVPGPSGLDDDATFLTVAEAIVAGPYLTELNRPIVLDGHLPLGPGEVAIDESFAARRGVGVGDRFQLAAFPAEDIDRVGGGQSLPEPEAVTEHRVAAVIRQPADLARSPQSQPGTIFESDEAGVVLAPDYWAEHGGDVASYGRIIIAEPPDPAGAIRAMQEVAGEQAVAGPGGEDLPRVEPVGDAIGLESNAVLAIGLIAGLATLIVLGPAFARLVSDDRDERLVLRSIGFTPRQLLAMRLARSLAVAVPAAVLGVGLAVLASPLMPIGLARDAEIDPGVHADWTVLLLGAPALAALLVGRGAIGERVTVPAPARRSRAADVVAQAGGSPTATLGTQLALEAASGRSRSAPRATLGAAVIGVAAVSGAVSFAATLQHLSGSPERQGWVWDVVVGNYSTPDAAEEARQRLERSPVVAAFAGYNSEVFDLDGRSFAVVGFELDDDIGPVVLEGRAALAPDEIALGRGTLAAIEAAIGDRIEIEIGGRTTELEVVGEIVAPAVIESGMDLDSGGAMTFDGLFLASGAPESVKVPVSHLVTLRSDLPREEALAQLREDFPGTVLGPMQPLDLQDLTRVRRLPYAIAGVLGLMALLSVGIMVAVLARRRRREFGILRALGFDRARLRSLLAAQTTAFMVLTLALGVPAGIVAGRLAWQLAADGLGSEVGPTVPLSLLGWALLVVVVTNLGTRALALGVARRPTAEALRAE